MFQAHPFGVWTSTLGSYMYSMYSHTHALTHTHEEPSTLVLTLRGCDWFPGFRVAKSEPGSVCRDGSNVQSDTYLRNPAVLVVVATPFEFRLCSWTRGLWEPQGHKPLSRGEDWGIIQRSGAPSGPRSFVVRTSRKQKGEGRKERKRLEAENTTPSKVPKRDFLSPLMFWEQEMREKSEKVSPSSLLLGSHFLLDVRHWLLAHGDCWLNKWPF